MTYECSSCNVRWLPYQTNAGTCPACGSGTKRTNEGASRNAAALFRALKERGQSADLHERFDEFYADRERKRDAAQATESIDSLEIIGQLPTREPDTS